ncbi:MAG: hypothetical protein HOP09_06370 [Hyphomicrobium sp.]|nr:hypothetical protein [Hyphomicrobium sp.]
MSNIFIEGKPVAGSSDESLGVALHAYIVYADADGNEWVLRGGPGGIGGLSSFGSIAVQSMMLDESKDARGSLSPADRGQIALPIGDERSADDVFYVMDQLLAQIGNQQITYYPYSTLTYSAQNSNSTAANLLQLVGIDFASVEPQPSGWTPAGYEICRRFGQKAAAQRVGERRDVRRRMNRAPAGDSTPQPCRKIACVNGN